MLYVRSPEVISLVFYKILLSLVQREARNSGVCLMSAQLSILAGSTHVPQTLESSILA